MSRRSSQPFVLGLLLAAGSVASRPARGQVPTPDTASRPALDGTRLRPTQRVYRLTVMRAGLPSSAGERTVGVREMMQGEIAAWSIAETRVVPTATTFDSLVVTRTELTPLQWQGTAGGSRLAAGFTRDTMFGAVSSPTGNRSVIVALRPGVVLSAAMLETVVPLLPLQVGWTTPLPTLIVNADGGRVVPAQLAVEREESIDVPAGHFDCWVVTLRTEHAVKVLWVSRDGRGVIRTEERLPDVDGAVLEQALVSARG